jgi:DNA helicase-2/ATP-dependent DNA helicase PcrA
MSFDIDTIILKKKEIQSNIIFHQRKIIELETELIKLEQTISSFNDINIMDNLVLSEQQRKIVDSTDKNILVVACPGSGKTHTLISRYIHLVTKKSIDPSKIILITFTKKAGMEMNQRISDILPHKLPFYVGSLHGLGFRLLQQFNNINYTVLDELDSHKILRDCADTILSDAELEDEEIGLLRKQIVYIYDKVSTTYPANLVETIKNLSISSKYKTIISDILKEYKNTKNKQDLVDFNDLMILFCQLLKTKKINDFLNNIEYIFFDEYQDINPVQNYILSCFKQSNIMVVGDDAQAIYAFRGSSVKYIWEFEKNFENVKTYYLETNYRSTPSIVSFFQDIISHNTNQFKKNVKSYMTEPGMKPIILSHNSALDQYKWIAIDIANKHKEGIPLKNIVVLARKNSSLDCLEFELLKYSVPVVKSIGISLLNKVHIKDFIAFLTIMVNPKSTIHWRRILALHRNIGNCKENDIINISITDNISIIDAIKKYNTPYLDNFLKILTSLNTKSDGEKIYIIQNYLFTLWQSNFEKNIETRENDIITLVQYMKNNKIDEFINNIHLNLEINNMEDYLFLSTVHGSKGLEWDHVYILDMDCINFPNIRQSYYKDELDNCMEERRLFYVGASRAKKYLYINFYRDNEIVVSPFIRELNTINYIGSNLKESLAVEYKYTGNISIDVNNYLRYNGYTKLTDIVNIPSERHNIGYKLDLPAPTILKNRMIAGNTMDYLVCKMVHNNYHNIIEHFDLSQNTHIKIPEKLYHNYIDCYTNWRDILNDIFKISTYKSKYDNINRWEEILLDEKCINFYNMVEKCIIKLFNKLLNKDNNNIKIHTNITFNPIKGEIDILINNTLIEMKTTPDDACTFPNLCQSIMYGWLLLKKNINVDKIIILNLWNGTIDTFDMTNFNYKKFKKTLYNVD